MNILSFKEKNYLQLCKPDNTQRDIGYSSYNNCILTGRNHFYTNVLVYNKTQDYLISPYDEKIMSLNKDSFYDNNIYTEQIDKNKNNLIETPVFFFIYNFDNYYHFLYDTLPYLYIYLEIKKNIPELKLLVNYPNKNKKDFYKFNIEFLEKIIDMKDLIIHSDSNIYCQFLIGSSLTHGGYSNNQPRNEINQIYEIIKSNTKNITGLPKRVYISRRTWLNSDKSNIGTDYTTRRKMINEDELVDQLVKNGFVEIFAENLSTDEKISLFSNAEIIIGSIGGGMANLLFSSKQTKAIVLVTPYFLDINYRFRYSLENADLIYFNFIQTYKENNSIPLFCRVKINLDGRIGEIIDYTNNKYIINLSNNDIAGFNNLLEYEKIILNETEFKLLDNGLNSPYKVYIDNLIKIISN